MTQLITQVAGESPHGPRAVKLLTAAVGLPRATFYCRGGGGGGSRVMLILFGWEAGTRTPIARSRVLDMFLKQCRTPDALEDYCASPVAANGKIFLISASGKVTVLKADARWEVLAMNDLGEEVWATPAIASEISSSARAIICALSQRTRRALRN